MSREKQKKQGSAWLKAAAGRTAGLLFLSVVASWFFWSGLWTGGGFVGGDVYSYYFPQKVFYSECLHAGEFPFWNNRTGFGYPLIGESQTGVFYPTTLLFYWLWEVNTAYNANFLFHYVLAFCFAALYAESLGLSAAGAVLCALVYTYGWFPVRSCVEWAIIGGAWLPAVLWCVERFLTSGRFRFVFGLVLVTAVQLLAGHFQLAWITVLVVLSYVLLRTWWNRAGVFAGLSDSNQARLEKKAEHVEDNDGEPVFSASRHSFVKTVLKSLTVPRPLKKCWQTAERLRLGRPVVVLLALAGGFALAAVQLWPTWELKQLSQRADVSAEHNPGYGILPSWYLAQVVTPWKWYTPLVDRDSQLERWAHKYSLRTNQVEAHLYFGLFPLALAVLGLLTGFRSKEPWKLQWLVLCVFFLAVATGVLLPVVRVVPGFKFFEGLGRYTVVVQLGVGLLAGAALEELLQASKRPNLPTLLLLLAASLATGWLGLRLTADAAFVAEQFEITNPLFKESQVAASLVDVLLILQLLLVLLSLLFWKSEVRLPHFLNKQSEPTTAGPILLCASVFVASSLDLWLVSRLVGYTDVVPSPPIKHLADSPVQKVLREEQKHRLVRLYAPGANFPTTLGVSALPVYLTFGPKQYVQPDAQMPRPEQFFQQGTLDPEQLQWLQWAGVTHLLSFQPVRVVEPSLDEKHHVRPVNASTSKKSTATTVDRFHSSASQATSRPTKQKRRQMNGSPAAHLQLLWAGIDPVLNYVWGRAGQPLFLYRLLPFTGRLRWNLNKSQQTQQAHIDVLKYQANRVVVQTTNNSSGTLTLTDLAFPGWWVQIDNQPARPIKISGSLFRSVELPAGSHTVVWVYRPESVRNGATLSALTAVLLALLAHVVFWHTDRF